MRISQIIAQINTNLETVKQLQNQSSELLKANARLEEIKESKQRAMLMDYIEIGSTYTFNGYAYLTGVQTGSKEFNRPNFISGDIIEFVKKNQKSIVVKCLKKNTSKWDSLSRVTTYTETFPNTIFRVDADSLYHHLMSRPEFRSGFNAYISRREALDELGI